jgi:hypothetical protein
MSATEIRRRLSDYHAFLTLVRAVLKDRNSGLDEVEMALNSVAEFLRAASSRNIRERGKELDSILGQAVRLNELVLPRRKGVREIARDFYLLLKGEPDIWRFGIQRGWLSDRFDVSRLPQAEDLPRHARVGIGLHAGRALVEEISLLQDVFFLLVRARSSFEILRRYGQAQALKDSQSEHLRGSRLLSALNGSVCTYSRLGVLTAVSFVETFVNSVGWNEAAARSDLSEQEKSELQGTRKGKYLSLEAKLERMPRIIREDKTSPIILSDEKQKREPFISFFRETNEVRNASMHYAPGKAPILHPPQDWLRLVEAAVEHAVAVAREFWSACYPKRQQPKYLASLYYDGLVQEALDRLTAVEAGTEVNMPDIGLKQSDAVFPRGPAT